MIQPVIGDTVHLNINTTPVVLVWEVCGWLQTSRVVLQIDGCRQNVFPVILSLAYSVIQSCERPLNLEIS